MKHLFLLVLVIISAQNYFPQEDVKFYSSGMNYYNNGDYSLAISNFKKIKSGEILSEELFASSRIYIAESYLGIEQFDAAISEFENFIKNFPTSNFRELAFYRLGTQYFDKKLYEQSRNNLISLIKEFPLSEYLGSAYHLVGETFIEENDFAKAEKFFSSAVNSKENNMLVDRSIFALANVYEKEGEYSKAVTYYDKLLGYHRNSDLAALAQLRIGVCYFYLNEFDNSVLELSDPLINDLNIDQQNEANYILANAFFELREYKNATEAYKRILNNSPDAGMLDRIRYGIAWINFQQHKFNDAYKLFSLLAKSQDDSIALKSLYWSGESKRYAGDYGEAIEIHRQFVELYPNHPYSNKVLLNIGISKFSQNSYSESEESLLELLKSSDSRAKIRALTLLGEINLKKQNYNVAAEYFERGLFTPNINEVYLDRCNLGLGVANFFNGNSVKALEFLNKVNSKTTRTDLEILNFYKAEVYFSLGNYNDALTFYNRTSSENGDIQKFTIYGKAYSNFNLKDFEKAEYYFTQFLKNYENDALADECKLRLADSYYGQKDFSKAAKYYEDALVKSNKFKSDDRSFFNYAQSIYKSGNSSKAISMLEELQTKFPASKYADDSQYLIAWINFQNSKFPESILEYQKLFDNYPTSVLLPLAQYSIGDCYFNQGDYPKAIDSYNKVVIDFPNSNFVYDAINGIQYSFIVQDKQIQALSYLESYIKANPTYTHNDKIQFKRAEIYYSAGDYNSALKEYQILIDEYSESDLVPEAYYWMGKSSVLAKNLDRAKDFFKEVISYSINTEVGFNSVIELGKLYRIEKDYDDEIELYEKVIPNILDQKRIGELKYIKSQNYIEQQKLAEAYLELNGIVDLRDGSLFYYKAEIELGILELSREKYDNSIYLLKDVVENREDDLAAQAQYFIGQNYFEQDKMAEAITELIKVRSLYSAYDEWYTKALILLGDCYVQIDNKVSAAEMYKSVLKRHRNDLIAKEVQEKLNNL